MMDIEEGELEAGDPFVTQVLLSKICYKNEAHPCPRHLVVSSSYGMNVDVNLCIRSMPLGGILPL